MDCRAALLGTAIALWIAGCAPLPPEVESPSIQIVAPSRPLAVTVAVREGSFDRSHLSPRGVLLAFLEELDSARVFARVLDRQPADADSVWELEMAASDYGEEDAYTLELQVVLLRRRVLIATYWAKESLRQETGTGRQLSLGPEQLAELAQRAIRELVRQLAADAERLRVDEGVGAS